MKTKLAVFLCVILLGLPALVFSKTVTPKRVAATPGYQNELLVIGALKRLYDAQARYYNEFSGGTFGTLQELSDANVIDEAIKTGQKFGYVFTFERVHASSTLPSRFSITARPRTYRKTGKRSFYINSTCIVRGADKNGSDASETDPLIDTCTPTIAVASEARIISAAQTMASAQFTYAATAGNGLYGTLNELTDAGLIELALGTGLYSRHFWVLQNTAPTTMNPALFKIWMTPMAYRETGIRSFFIDQTGVLRGADRQGAQAQADDPPVN